MATKPTRSTPSDVSESCVSPASPQAACVTKQCYSVCVQDHWATITAFQALRAGTGTGADTKQLSESTRVAGSSANIWSFYQGPSRTKASDSRTKIRERSVSSHEVSGHTDSTLSLLTSQLCGSVMV